MAPTAAADAPTALPLTALPLSALPLTALPLTALPLTALLRPRGIAHVGVKGGAFDPAARDNMARRFLENLQRHGYPGAI